MGQAKRAGGGDAGVVLIVAEVGDRLKVVFRVQKAVVVIGVEAEVVLIGSMPGIGEQNAAAGVAQLGREGSGGDLEFFDRFRAGRVGIGVVGGVGGRQAVDEDFVGDGPAAAEREVIDVVIGVTGGVGARGEDGEQVRAAAAAGLANDGEFLDLLRGECG